MVQALSLRFSARIPSGSLAAICDDIADVLLALDDGGAVMDASTTLRLPQHTVARWIGQRAPDIATPDSTGKLRRMLDEPAPAPETQPWRHVNLQAADGSSVPLLMRIYRLDGAGPLRAVLFGRDLSPLQDASDRFQRSQHSIVRHYEDHLRDVTADCRRQVESSDIGRAARQVGHMPVDRIVANVARRLRWLCAQEALSRHGGDRPRAAAQMGLADAELDRIIAEGPGD